MEVSGIINRSGAPPCLLIVALRLEEDGKALAFWAREQVLSPIQTR
jgi:hypothetical protein